MWGPNSRTRLVGLGVCVGVALGCSKDEPPVAARELVPTATTTATASASAAPQRPPPPPTMAPVAMHVEDIQEGDGAWLHTIDGAVIVTSLNRVGRLLAEGDGVEWIGKIPKGGPPLGDNTIRAVTGQWPEEVAVVFHTSEGRAPQPTYFPVKGDGGWFTFADGGGAGMVYGSARSGETTTIAGFDMVEGDRIAKVRDPMVKPQFARAETQGCEGNPPNSFNSKKVMPAVAPWRYTATRAGTIVSFGRHCKDDDAAAIELWRKPTEPSEIINIQKWFVHGSYLSADLLRGKGDTIYIVGNLKDVILRLKDGVVAPMPDVPFGRRDAFVSTDGTLFATNGRMFFELIEDRWEPKFQLAWALPMGLASMGKRFFGARDGQVNELKPTASIELDPEAGGVSCPTPLVHVLDVVDKTPKNSDFADVQQHLAAFEPKERLKLVDFLHGVRRLGIVADDWNTARAVWRHLHQSMSDHDVRLVCFEPTEKREVKLTAAAPPAPSASAAAKPAK